MKNKKTSNIARIKEELLHGRWHGKKLMQQMEDANFIRGSLIKAEKRVEVLKRMDREARSLFIRRCGGG